MEDEKKQAIENFDEFCKKLHQKKITIKTESKIYLKVMEMFEKGVRAEDLKGDF